MMLEMQSISTGLELGDDGIWYSEETKNVSYPAQGHGSCFDVEEHSFWFKHRNHCISLLARSYPPVENGTIFDVGGGNGFVSAGLANAGFSVALVEPGKIGVKNARKRGLENVVCATTDSAQFKANSLPAIGLFDVIEHIEDDRAFLRSMHHLMKEGAPLYATVPAYSMLWSSEDITAGHFRRYTVKSISNVLEEAGFTVEFSSYIFRFLPIPILLLRALPYRLGLMKAKQPADTLSRDHAAKEGGISKLLNTLLRSEMKILKAGKRMLFGGSCLIVARKKQ